MYFALPTCVNAFYVLRSPVGGCWWTEYTTAMRCPTALGVVRRDYAKPLHKLTVVYVLNHLEKQEFLGQRVHKYCACG